MRIERIAAFQAARRAVLGVAVSLFLGGLAATADAGEIEVFAPGAHSLKAELPAGEEHYIPFDLPEGTFLDWQFRRDKKADKTGTFVPDAELVGPDGTSITIPSGNINSKKGFDVKKLLIEKTGRYILVLRDEEDDGGFYSFKAKAKFPKSVKGELDGATDPLEIPFAATNGAVVTASVKGKKGGAVPELPKVRLPSGQEFGPAKNKQGKTGFKFSKFAQQGEFGIYAVLFKLQGGTEAGDRNFKYAIKVKWPKVQKAKLTYDDIVVAPLVTSVTPNELPVAPDLVQMTISGRFFQAGASFVLTTVGEPDWRPEGQVATPNGITCQIRTQGRAPGAWDAEIFNPSGGNTVVGAALLVRPPTPTIISSTPGFTVDDRPQATIELIGAQLSSGTLVEIHRDIGGGQTETIPTIDVRNAPSGGIFVDFSPFRRALGFYDVSVTNPGNGGLANSDTTTKTNVFEIRNAPPRIDAAGPGRNLAGGAFTMTIDGGEFEPGAAVEMQRAGEQAVLGTSVSVAPDGLQVTATFDMDAAATGAWGVRVTNTDQQTDFIADVFAVSGSPAASLTDNILGPADVAMADEHDLAIVVWVETDEDAVGAGATWTVQGRILDTFLNQWTTNAFTLNNASGIGGSVRDPIRDVSVAYNPDVDRFLVVWSEQVFMQSMAERVWAGASPTSGNGLHIFGRQVDTTGTTVGGEIAYITNAASATSAAQIYDTFHYFNPTVVYAPWNDDYYLCFSQRWDDVPNAERDQTGGYPTTPEDYDVFVFMLDKDDPVFDANNDVALHTQPNRESGHTISVDRERDQILAVGRCNPTNISGPAALELQCRFVDSSLGFTPSGANNEGQIVASLNGGTISLQNPRSAYNASADEFLVVFERVNEAGSGNKEIRAQRMDAIGGGTVGAEITVATDASHDLVLPRVVYNGVLDEWLVFWTVDDPTGTPKAMAQRLTSANASKDGSAFQIGDDGDGHPVVGVHSVYGTYSAVVSNNYAALGSRRIGDAFSVELFE